ncbi:hypothetical protein BN1221_03360c [Brenneria goodwinii]|uniref:Uncharacterized protein n=1 Tax=Brenneria goodwinii TaxID=1109412 RepID=A0A0G4JY67_9GAMM|nr:hypothetical protein BN1221_03360c [Brenneria goodwinii]
MVFGGATTSISTHWVFAGGESVKSRFGAQADSGAIANSISQLMNFMLFDPR